MRNLIIDIGNTVCKAAILKERQLESLDNVKSDRIDLIVNVIKSLQFDSAIVSSVADFPPQISQVLSEKAGKVILMNKDVPLPLKNLYETPESLGTDRLALAVGGMVKCPGKNVLVIDAGTCITYDFVNDKKEYLGGAISAGIAMRFKALHEFTHSLPLIEMEDIDQIIGTSTKTSLLSGVINSVIFEIEGFIKNYKAAFAGTDILLTGGNSFYLANKLKSINFAEQNLLLYGLEEILLYNK